jgi:hypothetical protein
MPKIVKHKNTGKTVYRRSPEFKTGKGIESACSLYGFDPDDLEEIEITKEEYDTDLQAEFQSKVDINIAKNAIINKYNGKKKTDITDVDALEWIKLKMVQELGLAV